MKSPANLLEINAYVFLAEQSPRVKSLAEIPQSVWDKIAARGFDTVWLMGIWKRSPGAKKAALTHESLRKEYDSLLPGWNEDDVTGSPYAIYDYEPDPALGTFESLTELKKKLNKAGLLLFLDYVPNHLAFDHPLTLKMPAMFVQGTPRDLHHDPQAYFKASNGRIYAHGRDPHFSGWSDTVQLNYFESAVRVFAVETLMRIASIADGVRCDMAMLGLNEIFEKTWKTYLNFSVGNEFWDEVISKVKRKYPKFIFMAEVYWDLEKKLQNLGFDYTYDKRLYDRLLHNGAREVREHLLADLDYQQKSVRFIENHDEERAAAAFGDAKSQAAAAVIATVPGLHFFHKGQMEGKHFRHVIQLGQERAEAPRPEFSDYYAKLLKWIAHPVFFKGQWQLHESLNYQEAPLLAWSWYHKNEVRLIVINYTERPASGNIYLSGNLLHKKTSHLHDAVTQKVYTRSTAEVLENGLYIHLEPWQFHLFEWKV